MQWMACGWYRLKIAPEPEQKQPRKDRKITSLENNELSYFSICLNCFGGLVYCSSASSLGASFQPWCFLHFLLHWPHFGMGQASRYQPHIQTSVHDLCLPTKMLMFGGKRGFEKSRRKQVGVVWSEDRSNINSTSAYHPYPLVVKHSNGKSTVDRRFSCIYMHLRLFMIDIYGGFPNHLSWQRVWAAQSPPLWWSVWPSWKSLWRSWWSFHLRLTKKNATEMNGEISGIHSDI